MKLLQMTVTGLGTDATLVAGDELDLGDDGIIVWLAAEDAEAHRLRKEKRYREMQAVIERVASPLVPAADLPVFPIHTERGPRWP